MIAHLLLFQVLEGGRREPVAQGSPLRAPSKRGKNLEPGPRTIDDKQLLARIVTDDVHPSRFLRKVP